MLEQLRTDIEKLAAMRRRRVIVLCSGGSLPKSLDDSDVVIFYELLRRIGPVDGLALVLTTPGGQITAARRLSLLIREVAPRFEVLVPYTARSAGTLLCLAADRLVLGPLAELGPLDVHLASSAEVSQSMPITISAEDIRAFRRMAESWFDLSGAEHRMRLFEVLSQRVFPTSLGRFFRAELQMRQIAEELIRHQLPEATDEQRREIVDRLITGFPAHDHAITRREAAHLGLKVDLPGPEEEQVLWDVFRGAQALMNQVDPEQPALVNCLLVSSELAARHRRPARLGAQPPGPEPAPGVTYGWELVELGAGAR